MKRLAILILLAGCSAPPEPAARTCALLDTFCALLPSLPDPQPQPTGPEPPWDEVYCCDGRYSFVCIANTCNCLRIHGDFDCDGDADLGDLDGDGDVDLMDFAAWQRMVKP